MKTKEMINIFFIIILLTSNMISCSSKMRKSNAQSKIENSQVTVSPSTNSNVEEVSDNTVLVMILFVVFIIILGYVLYFIKMYRNINRAVQYAQPIMQ